LQIQHLSFSAHTDAKGILDLVKHVAPRNVVLVHGEKPKMVILKKKISSDLGTTSSLDYWIGTVYAKTVVVAKTLLVYFEQLAFRMV
jgi:predicted metal-dependent RNase